MLTRIAMAWAATCLLLGGCASSTSGNVYPRTDVRKAWTVEYGEVADVEAVTIEGERTRLGRIGGGFIGHELGRTVGGGSGRRIAGAAGAVAGAVVGQAVEQRLTQERGYQITVELPQGRTIAVVQAADEEFRVGDRVKLLRRGDGAARVTHR